MRQDFFLWSAPAERSGDGALDAGREGIVILIMILKKP